MQLNLFFTQGVSLYTWHETGMLARELALYHRLLKESLSVKFVTYGNRSDHRFTKQLQGIQLATNDFNLPLEWYQRKLEVWPPKGDVFKSNQVAGADVALASARRAKAKFVARCGYLLSDFQGHKHGEKSTQFQEAVDLEKKVFGKADRVVVTTRAMKAVVVERYLVSDEKISVIPNYVETQRFNPPGRSSGSRVRLGFVGRLDTQKNVPALLEAVRDMDIELHLVGYGPLQEELSKSIQGSRAQVTFRGSIPNAELPDFLRTCHIFVLPSLYEGHPKALLEAMSVGLAVVGTRVAGIRELITDGEDGLLCEPDSGSLRSAIEKLVHSEPLRKKLGAAARKLIEKEFSLDRIVTLEKDMLQAVVNS